MKKFVYLFVMILVTGLCFAKPVFKTSEILGEEFEFSYTSDKKEAAEIVQLLKMTEKEFMTYDAFIHVVAPSCLFARRNPADVWDIVGEFRHILEDIITTEQDYAYCIVRKGKYFAALKLSKE